MGTPSCRPRRSGPASCTLGATYPVSAVPDPARKGAAPLPPHPAAHLTAYVIVDIFSQYTVERAKELIRETIVRNGIVPGTVHADRSTSITFKRVCQLLIDLGVTRSHSRPKVSNDNPYSEAQFKTTKYMSDYPERFDSLAHAREWFEAFIAYYNHEHRHSGIGWHTPASVHFGITEEVRDQRAAALAEACTRHPERFGRRAPTTPDTPAGVDQRPGQAQRIRSTKLIASRPSHWTSTNLSRAPGSALV
ncbi:transposase [Streptomyces ardesiacus]|uniref:transposase n=1 Tax=Streptomyces ardesiacus TaxID=285564 RepID=UPI00355724C4